MRTRITELVDVNMRHMSQICESHLGDTRRVMFECGFCLTAASADLNLTIRAAAEVICSEMRARLLTSPILKFAGFLRSWTLWLVAGVALASHPGIAAEPA